MRLSIVTGVCGAIDITFQWFQETILNTLTQPEVIVVANGCSADEVQGLKDEVDSWHHSHHIAHSRVLDYPDPMGSTATFNAGWLAATGDVVAMLHNDLMIKTDAWDELLLDFFEETPDAGVVGFHGARSLGTPDIYRSPYRLAQLARGDCWSNMVNAEDHGGRTDEIMEVVTLDGMALCATRSDLAKWGGLDERYPHHMYDHDLCLTARNSGRTNFLLPLICDHVSGQTSNADRYQKRFGPDDQIHTKAHQDFYNKWHNRLPQTVAHATSPSSR